MSKGYLMDETESEQSLYKAISKWEDPRGETVVVDAGDIANIFGLINDLRYALMRAGVDLDWAKAKELATSREWMRASVLAMQAMTEGLAECERLREENANFRTIALENMKQATVELNRLTADLKTVNTLRSENERLRSELKELKESTQYWVDEKDGQ